MKTNRNIPFTNPHLHTVSRVSNLLLHFPGCPSVFEIIHWPQVLPTCLQFLVPTFPARQPFPEYTSTSSNTLPLQQKVSCHQLPQDLTETRGLNPTLTHTRLSAFLPSPREEADFPLSKLKVGPYPLRAGHSVLLLETGSLPLLHLLRNRSSPLGCLFLTGTILVFQLTSF